METLLSLAIPVAITIIFVIRYMVAQRRREAKAREAISRGEVFSDGPRAQHPKINAEECIGCGACTNVCPEGDVLGMLGGKAVIINGYKCIGHSLCAEACPVGAITMVRSSPSMGADMPALSAEFETSIPNIFVIGELGGLALIKNAVNQGRECVDLLAQRLAGQASSNSDVLDVVIVGAGPAGISASLRAIEKGLRYLTIEQDQVGGTVSKYPRQKLVMTSPVELPIYGRFKKRELSKESLLELWSEVLARQDFKVHQGEKLEHVSRGAEGVFTVHTDQGTYATRSVILALGRTGTPRKLGVPGEQLPKVMYRLIEADHYRHKKVLVVGGGDSAIEAALGLAHQPGNKVCLSYRRDQFTRIKTRNQERIEEAMRNKTVHVLFNSQPLEIREHSVVLEVGGQSVELGNDYVWIFAGGNPPNDLLKKIGIQFGDRDLTVEGSREAQQALEERRQSVSA